MTLSIRAIRILRTNPNGCLHSMTFFTYLAQTTTLSFPTGVSQGYRPYIFPSIFLWLFKAVRQAAASWGLMPRRTFRVPTVISLKTFNSVARTNQAFPRVPLAAIRGSRARTSTSLWYLGVHALGSAFPYDCLTSVSLLSQGNTLTLSGHILWTMTSPKIASGPSALARVNPNSRGSGRFRRTSPSAVEAPCLIDPWS